MEQWKRSFSIAYKWAQTWYSKQKAQAAAQPDAQAQAKGEIALAQQVTALTPANLKKQEQVAGAARQQSLQAQRRADAVTQQTAPFAAPLAPVAAAAAAAPAALPAPAATLTGSPDGAAVWVPKSGLKQENLIWPPPKRRKPNTPITSPHQKTSSQSPPNIAATLSVTPKPQYAVPAPGKDQVSESPKPMEIFKCLDPRGFPQKDMLAKHMEDHRRDNVATQDPLGHLLGMVRSGLGLNRGKKEEELAEIKSVEVEQQGDHNGASTTPVLAGVTPARLGLTPGKPMSPTGEAQTPIPVPVGKPLPPTAGKTARKEDTPMGGMDKVLPFNDQLPTPPSNSVWEGSISPNTIRQCFAGLEQFSGFAAPNNSEATVMDLTGADFGDKLTPMYTPGESPSGDDVDSSSGPGSDAESVGAGLLEDWNPFGEKVGGFTAGLLEDVDWDREAQRHMGMEGEMGSMWDVTLFELRC